MKIENDPVILTMHEWKMIDKELGFLQALRDAGVDNWEGYGYACEMAASEGDDE